MYGEKSCAVGGCPNLVPHFRTVCDECLEREIWAEAGELEGESLSPLFSMTINCAFG
jgi:hypothetical protein